MSIALSCKPVLARAGLQSDARGMAGMGLPRHDSPFVKTFLVGVALALNSISSPV